MYLEQPDKKLAKFRARPVTTSLALVMAVFFLFSSFLVNIFPSTQQQQGSQAQAFDLDQWVACWFGDDSIPVMMYELTHTDKLQFELRSKSAITSGISDVDGALNSIISIVSGHDFQEINEGILGTSLDPLNPNEDLEEADSEEIFNTGARVNPYDRFGVAGLNFTSYAGEWRYVIVDVCGSGEPTDPKAGAFYEDRLEPQSTWDDIPNSADIRTQQFDKGFTNQFMSALWNVTANWVFAVTKFIVTMTIVLVNFSFTDIVSVMGLDDLLAGDGTDSDTGLFGMLFDGLFMPLVLIAFFATGVHIAVQAFKRNVRKSFGGLVRSLVLFFVAFILAASPAFWISVPNAMVTTVQSIVITSLNSSLAGGSGICETDVANAKIVTNESADEASILEQASTNMSSSISCQFWQTFLLTPWAQGQWGTTWSNVWAQDADPDIQNMSDWDYLENGNAEMVGDAAVPVGNEEFINNWAIFNISTNTNAHSPLDHPGERSKITNGVSNDWYRIVDAVANYQEEDVPYIVEGTGPYGGTNETEITQPRDVPVTDEWNSWTGNESASRIWTAASSVAIAGIGLAAPLLFSFLSAVYSIGVSLLTALAPLFLLLGVWADRGWEMTKGWFSLLVNTMIARVVLGALLAVSIALTMGAIRMMDTIGWWQGMLMVILISVILLQSRHRILNAVQVMRAGTADFSQTARSLVSRTTGLGKGVARAGFSGVAGGVVAKRHGGSGWRGATQALGTEFRNQLYRHPTTHRALGQYEEAKMADRAIEAPRAMTGHYFCNACGAKISATPDRFGTPIFHGARDDNGNIYCAQCFNDGVRDDLREMTITVPNEHLDEKERVKEVEKTEIEKIQEGRFEPEKSSFHKSKSARTMIDRIEQGVDGKGNKIGNKQNSDQLKNLLKHVEYDIMNHRKASQDDQNVYPQPPEEIALYLDADLVAAAWRQQNYDWIRMSYIAAFAKWYRDTTQEVVYHKLEDLVLFVQAQDPTANAEVDKQADRQADTAEKDRDEQAEEERDRT